MGHPFKKSLFDNDDSAFQAPFLQHSPFLTLFLTLPAYNESSLSNVFR
jgi:hypothetical protein